MIRSELDVRAAFVDLAELAPETTPDRTAPSRVVAPARRSHPRRWAPVLAAAAVVTAVAGGSMVAHWTQRTPAASPPFRTATALNFDSTWDFGPTSLSGFSLSSSQLTPDGVQQYFYSRTDEGGEHTLMWIYTFAADAATNSELAALTPTTVGATQGYSGVLDAGTDELHRAVEATPNPPGKELPYQPLTWVFWPVGTDRWAAMHGAHVLNDTNQDSSQEPVSALLPIAAAAQPNPDPNVAFATIAYLPADARFADVTASSAIGSAGDELANGPDGMPGQTNRTVEFVRAGSRSPVLSVSALLDPVIPLTDGTGDQLPSLPNAAHGPYVQTSVAGHLAFVSDNAVIIQWADNLQIAVSDADGYSDDGHPLYPRAELLRVAASLTVASSVEIGQGYPLVDSLPASAFGQ